MADKYTIRVLGWRELMRACNLAEKETKLYVHQALREVGEVARSDAAARFARYDVRSAAGYRVRVRQRGVAVAQSIGTKTGKRGDYGALQMKKALLPSLYENGARLEHKLELALDKIADHFGAAP